jgi:hypothetical protein
VCECLGVIEAGGLGILDPFLIISFIRMLAAVVNAVAWSIVVLKHLYAIRA